MCELGRVLLTSGPWFWLLASVSAKILGLCQQQNFHFLLPSLSLVLGPRLVKVGGFLSSYRNPHLSLASFCPGRTRAVFFHHLSTKWHCAEPGHTPQCIRPVTIGGRETIHRAEKQSQLFRVVSLLSHMLER